jgi:hypothetical protein
MFGKFCAEATVVLAEKATRRRADANTVFTTRVYPRFIAQDFVE